MEYEGEEGREAALQEELCAAGLRPVATRAPSWAQLEARFPFLRPGGHYRPPNCTAPSRAALIIPFRSPRPLNFPPTQVPLPRSSLIFAASGMRI